MATRRQVIQGIATCTTLATFPAALSLSAAAPSMRFNKVLYDEREAAGLAFAAHARRLGANVHAVRGDVTAVWLNELQPQWKAAQTPTAGLTDYNSWFVLDMMARDAGMRTVYLSHHESNAAGYSHHQFGPHSVIAAPLDSQTERWSRQSAAIITQFPVAASVAGHQSTILQARDREIRRSSLVSWIIARPQTSRA